MFIRSVQFPDIMELAKTNEAKILDLLLALASIDCNVSLPKEANRTCKIKRFLQLQIMKMTPTLTESAFGFMVLDTTPQEQVLKTLLDPFLRFSLEGNLQTILANQLSFPFYNFLFGGASENPGDQRYKTLSMFLKMTSKLGGVSIIFSSRLLSQASLEIPFCASNLFNWPNRRQNV